VEVTALKITPRDIPSPFEFVGQTESSHQVEIRSRVDGFLEKRLYEEGEMVKSGQVMFQMDRRPFEASLQEAKGELAQQEARLANAKANLARIKPLAEKNAVSKKDLDDAIGNEQASQAAVIAAKGKVRQAELNLSYTTIRSPVTGLSSRAKKQAGSYISVGPDSLLTYVAKLNPIWVTFSVSENEQLKVREDVKKGQIKIPRYDNYVVEVVLADGTVFPKTGRLTFADPSFSQETGTYLVRATFPNPQSPGQLRPGQFVRVNLKGATRPKAIAVPRRAVQQGAKGHFVWVINKEGKAELRNVVVGDWYGDLCFISEGLKADEMIAVDGIIKLAAGVPVKIIEPPQAASPPATGGQPAGDQTRKEEAPVPPVKK
jgi:membrane fusion protein (multidrug efflux system)